MKMKKIVLLIAGLLIAAGIVLAFIAWASAGFDFRKLSTSDPDRFQTMQENYDAADLDKIEILIDVDDLEVRTSRDDQVHLQYTNYDGLYYEVSNAGGVLTLAQKSKSGWFRFDLFSLDFNEDTDVVLELPKNFDGDVVLSCDVGDIDMESVSLTGALDSKQGTGGFYAENLQARSVTASSDVGDVRGNGWEVEQYVSMTADTGDIYLERATATDLICHTDVGSVKLIRVSAKTTDLDTETGDIKLDTLATEKLIASTDVGDVRGSIDGAESEYTTFTKTDVGDSNLDGHKGTTDKEININTETGDIKLEFLR